MTLQVRIESDGSLTFETPHQRVVASLSRLHISLLQSLLDVPVDGPFVGILTAATPPHGIRRPQLVVTSGLSGLVPDVARHTTRLGLTATAADGTVRLTQQGQRLAQWLRQQWSGWMRYNQQYLQFQPTRLL